MTDGIHRRSFLAAAATGVGLRAVTGAAAGQSSHVLEVVTTERAELYYEFLVRGDVERTETSDTVGAQMGNDAIVTGANPDTHVVRGYTGNPGYGDAYAFEGDLLFFGQTGGTSDYDVRLDGETLSEGDVPRMRDPTVPGLPAYVEWSMDDTLGIVTPGQGEVFYEFAVEGSVEGGSLSDAVEAENGNDAVITGANPDTHVVRGYTGNPGYGDAWDIDGELVYFRRDGGLADVVFRLGDRELSLPALALGGTDYPMESLDPSDEDALWEAVSVLDSLCRDPTSPKGRGWYNHARGWMECLRTELDEFVEEGVEFRLDVGDALSVDFFAPGRPGTVDDSADVPASVLTLYAALSAMAYVGETDASRVGEALNSLLRRISTASDAVSSLYGSRPELFLLLSSTVPDPAIRGELLCHVTRRVGEALAEDAAQRDVARLLTERTRGLSVDSRALSEYATETFLAEPSTTPDVRVLESVVCGGIENEWHDAGSHHDHPHGYLDERYTYSRTDDDRVYAWIRAANVPSGRYTFEWFGPNGPEYSAGSVAPSPEDGGTWSEYQFWHSVTLSPLVDRGRWRVEFSFEGEPMAAESFEVVA